MPTFASAGTGALNSAARTRTLPQRSLSSGQAHHETPPSRSIAPRVSGRAAAVEHPSASLERPHARVFDAAGVRGSFGRTLRWAPYRPCAAKARPTRDGVQDAFASRAESFADTPLFCAVALRPRVRHAHASIFALRDGEQNLHLLRGNLGMYHVVPGGQDGVFRGVRRFPLQDGFLPDLCERPERLRSSAVKACQAALTTAAATGSVRLFSVRREFPNAWAVFVAADISKE